MSLTIADVNLHVYGVRSRYTAVTYGLIHASELMTVFTRTYFALAILVPVMFLLSLNVADNLFEEDDRRVFSRDAIAEARLLENELLQRDRSQWSDWVQAYEPRFDTRVSLLTSGEVAEREALVQALGGDTNTLMTPTASIGDWWLLHRIDGGRHYLWVVEDEGPVFNISFEDALVILIPLLMILLLVAGAIGYIARKIARPVNELSNVAAALGDAQFAMRARYYRQEPFRSLALQFNRMADRVQALVCEQQVIIGAIPHELRTPVSRIRFALDMTRSMESIEMLHRQIESIDDYAADLESIIEDTLVLSRIQIKTPDNQSFRIKALLQTLVEKYVRSSDKKITWACDIDTAVQGDPEMIRLVVGNLLDNAVYYSKSRLQLTVLPVSDDKLGITVDDDGPGIPKDKREAVFAPFYRLDISRSRNTGGIGLGLALVVLIAQRLNGTVKVGESPLGGARFVFCWPKG